jgi:hypothetical protein
MKKYLAVRPLVIGLVTALFAGLGSIASISPALATGATISAVEVVVPGGNNTQEFTASVTFNQPAEWMEYSFSNVTFNAPLATSPLAMTVTSTGYTECGTTGISFKLESGSSVTGTCETVFENNGSRIRFNFDVHSVLGSAFLFRFGSGSLHFLTTNPNELDVTWWAAAGCKGGNQETNQPTELLAQPGGTLTFDSNGGEGTMNSFTSLLNVVSIPSNTLTMEGHEFGGWNTSANGSGTAYADAADFHFSAGGATLYAQWNLIGAGSSNPGTPGETENLASTGFDSAFASGLSMSIIVAGGVLISLRRKNTRRLVTHPRHRG